MTTITDNYAPTRYAQDSTPEIPRTLVLSDRDRDQFLAALDNPPAPNAKLMSAAKAYKSNFSRGFAYTLGILIAIGCAGTAARYQGEKTIVYPDGSTFHQTTKNEAKTVTPLNASEQSGVDVSMDGAKATNPATWEAVEDYAKSNTWIFYVGALALGAGSVASFVFLRATSFGIRLSVGLGVLAGIAAITPEVLSRLGGFFAGVVAVGVIGVIAVGFFWAKQEFKIGGNKSAAKLEDEGLHAEAEAVRRETDKAYDREVRRIKKAKKKAKLVGESRV